MPQFNQSIWINPDTHHLEVIDQRCLPFQQKVFELNNLDAAAFAIKEMVVRGAPLIGVTAAYGLYIAARDGVALNFAYDVLIATRPTAINLKWALDRQIKASEGYSGAKLVQQLFNEANIIAQEDIEMCAAIGEHGLELIASIYKKKKATVNILTHCNAGWLATVQWGTALAPIYKAHLAGIPLHVWVDETRPRNQGARLTAWELAQANIPFKVVADNAGGHLMQHGMVDLVIVGSDRTTGNGDVCNKIGTYLKALAAYDNQIPFYAALPVSTIDWTLKDGLKEIPIEERSVREMTHVDTFLNDERSEIPIMAPNTPVSNYAFDVTPAKLITGIITERGICDASTEGLRKLYA
jgi:methylthioribose-1-phosphate isomerase